MFERVFFGREWATESSFSEFKVRSFIEDEAWDRRRDKCFSFSMLKKSETLNFDSELKNHKL